MQCHGCTIWYVLRRPPETSGGAEAARSLEALMRTLLGPFGRRRCFEAPRKKNMRLAGLPQG
eukprot:7254410-Heterocapsa_arctica.AAC.1